MQRTILYIEDDPASRSLVERTLRYGGYRVLIAECGLDGIDIARREMPDLILTDINLPDMSGREVTTMLRGDERFHKTPIVALTAQVLSEQRELALAAGLTGYLTKPLDVEGLLERVEQYMQGAQELLAPEAFTEAQARYTQELVTRLEDRVRNLESVNKSLHHLDKMKDTFIQLTAHELRTPLTLVYGYSRLIEDNSELQGLIQYDTNLRMLMEGMTGAIVRMQGIVNEILLVSRIMTNRIDISVGPTDLGDVARKAIKTYGQALVERNIAVHFDKAEWPEKMRADWELLELAMRNLVSNAIKYTPDGGSIYLTAEVEGDKVEFSCPRYGHWHQQRGAEDDLRALSHHQRCSASQHQQDRLSRRRHWAGAGGLQRDHRRAWRDNYLSEFDGYDPQKFPGSEFTVTLPLIAEKQQITKR